MEKYEWVQLRYMNTFGWWPSSCKTERSHKIFKTYGIILYSFALVLLVLEFVGLYEEIAKGSLSGCLLNLTTTLLGIQCCGRMTLFNVCRGRIKRIVNKLEELDQRVQVVLEDEVVIRLSAPSLKFCKNLKWYHYLGLSSTIQWFMVPLLARIGGQQAFIIETVFLWPTDTLPWWSFTFFLQLVHLCCAILPHFITDSLFWGFLAMLHRLHEEINTLIEYPLLLLHVCSNIVICLCIFRFSMIETKNFLEAFNLLEIFFIQIFMVFFHCFLSHLIEDQDVEITRAAYDSNWYEGNLSDKKSLVILMEGVKRKLSFGAIINTNLQAYISLLQTSFSYYNFLMAMLEMQESS